MTTLLVGVTVGFLVGDTVTGLEVMGAADGAADGLAVTGAADGAADGLAVTGAPDGAADGLAVTGAADGLEVMGAPDGLVVTGVPVGVFVLLRVGIPVGATEEGECVLPETRGLFESVGDAVTGDPVTGDAESVGVEVTGTAVGEWVGFTTAILLGSTVSPVASLMLTTVPSAIAATAVALTGTSAVAKS
jgi:hypothetical protein